MIEIIAYVLLGIGTACAIIGAIGILRFPDVYNRIHANTVVVVGGAIFLVLGAGILGGISAFTVKAVVIALFLFLTSPVSSHAIARAAHKSGIKLWPKSVADKLEEEKR
ncbi:MAG TPA: Na+/H+ antiporter subunit G [Hadesarchaea archaeon]|nr:Na+/H+ antiporter subunit G [Hadesarchaea archaeon]